MAELVASEIMAAGGTAEILPTAGYPVVLGEIDVGAPRTLLIYGMYDVQPVVGEDWLVPPFGGEVIDFGGFGPCMVSRGIINSKGPLVGFLCALRSLKAVEGSLPVNVKFLVEGEEELGSRNLPEFVRKHRDRLGADGAWFPFYDQDIKGKSAIYLGVKGLAFLELTARGGEWGGPTTRDVHAMNAVWFHSPVWSLTHALSTLLSPDQTKILIDGLYDTVEPVSPEDEDLLERLGPSFRPETQLEEYQVKRFKYDLPAKDLARKYLFEPSLNIDAFVSGPSGEGDKTVLPFEARAKVDIRLVPGMRPEQVVTQVKEHLRRRGFGHIEVNQHSGYPCSKGSIHDAANRTLLKACRALGYEPELWPLTAGAAPLYVFTEGLGIPLAMGGLGHGGRQHSPNEYATVEGMRLFEKCAAAYMVEFGK